VHEVSLPAPKQCPRCKRDLTTANYYHNKYTKDGFQTVCKDCTKYRNTLARSRHQVVVNPDSPHYASQLAAQQGRCAVGGAICEPHDPANNPLAWLLSEIRSREGSTRISVLVCRSCLNGISALRHSPGMLLRAASIILGIDAHILEAGIHKD
jgi:hypothetical protein